MEKLNARLDEIKKEEETINQALKKYEGALEYANILRSQLPEKVVMNDVKAAPLPTIPETKVEEVNDRENSPSALANGATGDVKQDPKGTEKSDTAPSSSKKKKKR